MPSQHAKQDPDMSVAQLKYCKTVEEADAAVAAITSRAVGFDSVLRRPKKDDELPDKHVAMVLLADEHWVILIHLERMHEGAPTVRCSERLVQLFILFSLPRQATRASSEHSGR